MTKDKKIYWVTTILATVMIVTPALFYFNEYMINSMENKMGFPAFFRVELAIGKYIGALIMLIPSIPRMIKEWVYVAFGITLISGGIAHFIFDGIGLGLVPAIPFLVLCISYYYFKRVYYEK